MNSHMRSKMGVLASNHSFKRTLHVKVYKLRDICFFCRRQKSMSIEHFEHLKHPNCFFSFNQTKSHSKDLNRSLRDQCFGFGFSFISVDFFNLSLSFASICLCLSKIERKEKKRII